MSPRQGLTAVLRHVPELPRTRTRGSHAVRAVEHKGAGIQRQAKGSIDLTKSPPNLTKSPSKGLLGEGSPNSITEVSNVGSSYIEQLLRGGGASESRSRKEANVKVAKAFTAEMAGRAQRTAPSPALPTGDARGGTQPSLVLRHRLKRKSTISSDRPPATDSDEEMLLPPAKALRVDRSSAAPSGPKKPKSPGPKKPKSPCDARNDAPRPPESRRAKRDSVPAPAGSRRPANTQAPTPPEQERAAHVPVPAPPERQRAAHGHAPAPSDGAQAPARALGGEQGDQDAFPLGPGMMGRLASRLLRRASLGGSPASPKDVPQSLARALSGEQLSPCPGRMGRLARSRRQSSLGVAPASPSMRMRVSGERRLSACSAPSLGPSTPGRQADASKRRASPLPRAPPASAPPAAGAPGDESQETPVETPVAKAGLLTVNELKSRLSEIGIDINGCCEKAELQSLWEEVTRLQRRSLAELQAACMQKGWRCFPTVKECVQFLAAPKKDPASTKRVGAASRAPRPGSSASQASRPGPSGGAARGFASLPTAALGAPKVEAFEQPTPTAGQAGRHGAAQVEVHRILALRRGAYPSAAEWGFAVLAASTKDVAGVQRAYRTLMKALHPDKVGQPPSVVKAVEMVREARELCERKLSGLVPPGPPTGLRYTAVCMALGRRRFRLQWEMPAGAEPSTVRRYIVSAFDPAYGKALTITVLEPDYSEELHRFVSVEELCKYELAEEDLKAMPSLFKQPSVSVHVAAANEAGQSDWTTLSIPLIDPISAASSDVRKRRTARP